MVGGDVAVEIGGAVESGGGSIWKGKKRKGERERE